MTPQKSGGATCRSSGRSLGTGVWIWRRSAKGLGEIRRGWAGVSVFPKIEKKHAWWEKKYFFRGVASRSGWHENCDCGAEVK